MKSAETLSSAWRCHQAGDLDRASLLYREILRAEPGNAEALALLGAVCLAQDRVDEAVEYLRAALARDSGRGATHDNLGVALARRGQSEEAVACFRRALWLNPKNAETHVNLAIALTKRGRREEAVASYRDAVRLRSDLAQAHNSLGVLLHRLGRQEEAEESLRRAVALQPSLAEAHTNLGNVLGERGRWDEAIASHEKSLRLRPAAANVLANLGNALCVTGRLDEAEGRLRESLRLKPDCAEAHVNLGTVFVEQGRLDDALNCFGEALALRSDYAEARHNRAVVWLLQGRWEEGWAEYEQRWRTRHFTMPSFPQPLWDGSPLEGKSILLHAEQGLGDTLQFVRYAPLVKRKGATVVLGCPAGLMPLLSRCPGIDRLSPGSPLPPFDVHAPLLSLPRLLGTTAENVPADVPYLQPEPSLVEKWRAEIATLPGFKVGIVWQGNPRHRGDQRRSVPLTLFGSLAQVKGVRLISLQKGYGAEQLHEVADRFPVLDLGARLDESGGAFTDTAAVMTHLDLVVTVDTAVAHLAGGLGVPCWVALPFAPDWRWLLDREDSPWYPSARLFRQKRLGDWESVFLLMAETLRQWLKQPETPTTLRIEVSAGELVDKISILRLKSRRLTNERQLRNVQTELQALEVVFRRQILMSLELSRLCAELDAVNEALWEVEDGLRLCEHEQEFGPRFVELARSVYYQNDRRGALKKRVNELLGSRLVEEKGYAIYNQVGSCM